jgi:hypothetical protein
VIAIALVLLAAVVLWGAWVFLRSGGGDHYGRRSPSNTTENLDDTSLHDVSFI